MITPISAVVSIVVIILAIAVIGAVMTWVRLRGHRVIVCPETRTHEAVEIAAGDIAFRQIFAPQPRVHLSECSRWPEREDCGQECLGQIHAAPDGCLAKSILTGWYEDKSCAFCRKSLKNIHWHDHKPAFLTPELGLVSWDEIPPETIFDVFDTHRPVCWNCFITESFRKDHADLVTERREVPGGPEGRVH